MLKGPSSSAGFVGEKYAKATLTRKEASALYVLQHYASSVELSSQLGIVFHVEEWGVKTV